MSENEQTFNLNDWYNPTEAAQRLSANCGRTIDYSYVRTLARYGKLRSYQISPRVHLYLKQDVDAYVVEGRGAKSARAQRQKALGMSRKKKLVA